MLNVELIRCASQSCLLSMVYVCGLPRSVYLEYIEFLLLINFTELLKDSRLKIDAWTLF